MSQPSAAQAMNQVDGQNYLTSNVYIPAFFNKLAAYGIVPENEQQANELLDMGVKLFNCGVQEQVKTADSRLSFLQQANRTIDDLASQRYGVTPQGAGLHKNSADDAIRRDCEALASDPTVLAAVLAYCGQSPQ